jgi:hypothetical protein
MLDIQRMTWNYEYFTRIWVGMKAVLYAFQNSSVESEKWLDDESDNINSSGCGKTSLHMSLFSKASCDLNKQDCS